MKQVNWKRILLPNLPYVFIALLQRPVLHRERITEKSH